MEIGWTPRPVSASEAGASPRIADAAPIGAVRTELPAAKTVGQVPPSAGLTLIDRAGRELGWQPPPEALDRRFEIDPASHQVVYQAVEPTSGEVVRQYPDEAILRLRAYLRAMRRDQPVAETDGSRLQVIA